MDYNIISEAISHMITYVRENSNSIMGFGTGFFAGSLYASIVSDHLHKKANKQMEERVIKKIEEFSDRIKHNLETEVRSKGIVED